MRRWTIRSFADAHALFEATHTVASCIAAEFGLVGINGLDFIARGRVPYPVEVNPRWSSSVEVAERAFDTAFFAAHAESMHGRLAAVLRLRPVV